MKKYITMVTIGAITGFLIAIVFANMALAASPDIDALDQVVKRNDECRIVVIRVDTGMTRLTFANKEAAQKAVDLMWAQAHNQASDAKYGFEFLSPDCDIDVESGK